MTAHDIDTAAAAWAARMDRGLTAAEQAELAAWTAADVRQAGALARAMAVLARVDALDRPAPSRRRFLVGGGALAAGFAAVAFGGVYLSRRGLTSAPREVRLARLADGTRVVLNGDTKLAPKGPREVVLERGEAVFEVAADPARPFLVRADGMDVTAAGGVFAVRLPKDGPRQVLVREGPAQARCDGQDPTDLVTGCWATASAGGEITVAHVGRARIARALAWAEAAKA